MKKIIPIILLLTIVFIVKSVYDINTTLTGR